MSNRQRLSMWVGTVIMALVAIVTLGWLIWRAMLHVLPNAARLWALATTALLPIAAWAGWWFGHTEARGRLAGIDQAVDKVMSAATRTVGLRVDSARALRHATAQEPPPMVLPDVEIRPRRLPSGDDIVEL